MRQRSQLCAVDNAMTEAPWRPTLMRVQLSSGCMRCWIHVKTSHHQLLGEGVIVVKSCEYCISCDRILLILMALLCIIIFHDARVYNVDM